MLLGLWTFTKELGLDWMYDIEFKAVMVVAGIGGCQDLCMYSHVTDELPYFPTFVYLRVQRKTQHQYSEYSEYIEQEVLVVSYRSLLQLHPYIHYSTIRFFPFKVQTHPLPTLNASNTLPPNTPLLTKTLCPPKNIRNT